MMNAAGGDGAEDMGPQDMGPQDREPQDVGPRDAFGVGPEDRSGDAEAVRLTAWARGRVQGVGFRWWVRSRSLELGLSGSATNLSDGRVEIVAEGPRASCERLLELLRGGDTPGRVASVAERWGEPRGEGPGFLER